MTPPPLPKPIRHHIFYGQASKGGIRLAGAALLGERIKNAHQQAEDWTNARTNIEVISLSNGFAENAGSSYVFLTLWYREG
ncbi:hypothetical protein [Roseibacillus persicicus]|uniref:hypothetical protein n=1 Tax=Roseibacillus persicicus TaxID=454148 RepID=UPI00280EF4AF|nr:hypothetical protein [Roseibacillus persicicus]MDQ8192003.1 hypothetical protein [Roseibacillus persicicus]